MNAQDAIVVDIHSIPPLALTRPNAARYCAVSVATIDRAVKANELRKTPIGSSHIVFLIEDLNAWLRSKSQLNDKETA